MNSRLRHTPLRSALLGRFSARTRAVALRLALRASAAAAMALALCVALGVLFPGEAVAWARLIVLTLAVLGALAWAAAGAARLSIGFEDYLERIERRFPEVRSWLRNALDFEARPPRDTSEELAA